MIIHIPNSLRSAGRELRLSLTQPLDQLSHEEFVRVWSALAYLFPNLHPDGYLDQDSGWGRTIKRFADEAWRRADIGELADEELYCCDAQWSGLYDRMHTHERAETERRLELSFQYGDGFAE